MNTMAMTLPKIPAADCFEADANLSRVVVNARSSAEMQLAITALRPTMDERGILKLVNLRAALVELPEPPFGTGGEISILERVAAYERTGRSYRREFISNSGLYGLEFCGDGNRVDEIVLHAPGTRASLFGRDSDEVVSSAVLDLILDHDTLLHSLVEGLQILGVTYLPRFHMRLEELMMEHAVESLEEINSMF